MIVVIADDVTGAAELAGVGVRYGLKVRICMEVPAPPVAGAEALAGVETVAGSGEVVARPVELLVIAMDTRSMKRLDAADELLRVIKAVLKLRPEWVYKKTDSVLRGHVVTELNMMEGVMDVDRTLLVPANPALGRTIKKGRYYINGVPIHETSFSTDPEFPVKRSRIREMLGVPVAVLPLGSSLPDHAIIVGEVETVADLDAWAGYVDKRVLPAGAAGFFEALLRKEGREEDVKKTEDVMRRPILFVSGTAFYKTREISKPAEGEIVRLLREEGKAMIAGWPREEIAAQVRQVLSETTVRELVIEGGATAYAVLRAVGLKSFVPLEELAPGVVRMRAGEMYITVKPGSYAWPEKLLTI
ncbi:MAG TPA: four-carbon acid sugar kinase family protein [Puia sp.]|jgi:uncharacterized protein YgbK (DUF1537 family)|nr:four-carbon acid sugar kinase family protein [Puia sp.]